MDLPSTAEPSPFEPVPWGEPVPNWKVARLEWKSTWRIHVYGFATVFLIFVIASVFRFAKLYSFRTARYTNGYHLKLCFYIAIFIFSLLRATVMFIDAYNSNEIFPPIIAKILWSLALPCLISAFTVLLAVLLATTNACHRGKSLSSNYKNGIGMGCCLIAYTALVIAADWAVVYSQKSLFLLLLCQVFFIAWGTMVMVGFAMISIKIIKGLTRTVLNVDRNLLRSFARLLAVCAAVGGLCIGVKFYAAVGTLSKSNVTPDPWPWLAFQTVHRLLECSICLLLILVTGKADKRREIQIVPKIMCNGVTVISGLESGTILREHRWKDMYNVT